MSWRGACRQEASDDEEREALAVRAAQVPGLRGRGAVAHDDALFEEIFDEHAAAGGGGVKPAEVAHAVLAWREDVLQIPSQKLLSAERAGAAHAGAAVGVGEAHRLVVGLEDAFVGDGGVLDVACEVLDDVFARTRSLDMDPPAVEPCRLGDLGVQARRGGAQRGVHAAAQGGGDGLVGEQVVGPAGLAPLAVVGSQAAAGHDEVEVRVVLELASAGVEYAE